MHNPLNFRFVMSKLTSTSYGLRTNLAKSLREKILGQKLHTRLRSTERCISMVAPDFRLDVGSTRGHRFSILAID
jgi:hypothetical protein